MTNDTIQQAQVTIQGTEPLIYKFDEARSRSHQASARHDAADLTCSALMLDVETKTLSFSPLVVGAWVREAARSLSREQQRAQLMDLAATIRVLDERIRITRARPPIATLDARDYPAYLRDHAPRIMGRMEPQETASRLWYANFGIQWCGTTTDSGDVRELLDYAGTWIGIGRGTARGFGRFLVHTFGIEIVNRPATA
jgi:hypothetical protein